MKIHTIILILITVLFGTKVQINAQATSLPLLEINQLEYEGAFIIPSDIFGESTANYSAGPIEVGPNGNTIFLAGHNNEGAIAEFTIPTLVNSTNLLDLNTSTIVQNFRDVLNSTPDNNPWGINRVSGLSLINNKLFVNAVRWYDTANRTQTTLIIDDPTDIVNSNIKGYYELEGAAHSSGWMTPIPSEWQTLLGGDYIAGAGGKFSISGRLSIGVSAFVFDPTDFDAINSGVVNTTPLMDYDLNNTLCADYNYPFHGDNDGALYNMSQINGSTPPGHTFADADGVVGNNDLWTILSQASYGFIVPGTRTYLSIGSSAGHNMGLGYKAIQNDGYQCGGPCPYDSEDRYNYYWLWDVNDLLSVKEGTINPYDVRPYDYGVFDAPFQVDGHFMEPEFHPIMGGSYDSENELLYLSIYDGAPTTSFIARNPVIIAYKINSATLSTPSINNENMGIIISPNPVSNNIRISVKNSDLEKVSIYDLNGRVIRERVSNIVNVSDFSSGMYLIDIELKDGRKKSAKIIIK